MNITGLSSTPSLASSRSYVASSRVWLGVTIHLRCKPRAAWAQGGAQQSKASDLAGVVGTSQRHMGASARRRTLSSSRGEGLRGERGPIARRLHASSRRRLRVGPRLLLREAVLTSELYRLSSGKKQPGLLPSTLTHEQIVLLLEIVNPYLATGSWPVSDFVVRRMDRNKLDAREIVASLPRVGSTGTLGPSYGFTVGRDWRMFRDGEQIRLTVAAGVPLAELRPVLADPFLQVLRHMIAVQGEAEPSPSSAIETWLDSQELARALPDLTPDFIAALPQILEDEPSTWHGSSRGPNPPADLNWSRQVTREIQAYAEVKDLESYVAAVCRIVTEQARAFAGVEPWLRGFAPGSAARPTPGAVAAPEATMPIYVKSVLIEELVGLDRAGGYSTDKLVQLCSELNFNFQHGQPLACHALLRAIMDHVPPAFAMETFAQVVSNVTWSRTDKAYLKKLEANFRNQGDDVMHRQIGPHRSRIDMDDMPTSAAVNHLLEGLCVRLREARDAQRAGS